MKWLSNPVNLAIVAGVLVCGALTVWLATVAQNPAQLRALKKDFGTEILELCDPPSELPAPDSLPGGNVLRKALVLENGSERWHSWSNGLPSEWKATSRADLGVVVCVGIVTIQDYICQGGAMYGTTTGERIDVQINRATVIDPVSRTVLGHIAFTTNSGSQACAADHQGNAESFLDAIRPYILG